MYATTRNFLLSPAKHLSRSPVGQRSVSSVGLIGLGNMGSGMAANIIKKMPDKSIFFDINPASIKKIAGAKAATSIKQLAASSEMIITMLPNSKHVADTCRGNDGIFKNAKKGSLIVDCSTIDPIVSKELAEEAKAHGLDMIDAPVSGGVGGALNGTLTFMVGGSDVGLQKAMPILQAMGKNIVHCGPSGAGEVTKLCNNLALAISMIGTSEAMTLGIRLGMDPKVLAGVMNTSTGRCWSSDTYNPCPGVISTAPSSRGYTGGFGTALMEKDLTLALDAAKAVKARLPLGSSAHQLYGLLIEHGYAEKDFSVVFEYLYPKHDKK